MLQLILKLKYFVTKIDFYKILILNYIHILFIIYLQMLQMLHYFSKIFFFFQGLNHILHH